MKNLNQYIIEKLKVSKNQNQYNYCPKTTNELYGLIKKRIREEGNNVNLNDIDVSNITDMTGLFSFTGFNGDISEWDVSNVTNMTGIFYWCRNFEGKGLENWDVSNVTNMDKMFYACQEFEGKGLENWDVSNVTNMREMFAGCNYLNCDLSKWDIYNVKYYADIFYNCPIKDEYKPKFR